MGKIVIGLMGEIGSGKGTFVEILQKITKKSIAQVKSSQILAETLDLWSLPKTRTNLQDLAIIMEKQYGEGTLAQAVRKRITQSGGEIVVYDGMRWQSDVSMIRQFPQNYLVYITSDPKIRFERIKSRNEKVGEAKLSYEQFLKDETKLTETTLSKISSQADYKILNNGGIENFTKQVEQFFLSCC